MDEAKECDRGGVHWLLRIFGCLIGYKTWHCAEVFTFSSFFPFFSPSDSQIGSRRSWPENEYLATIPIDLLDGAP